mmetsp:Transcript_11455/g.21730  ORF Transcript_11455/g.21730 Transcript_11455/m.21730 type:complete len:582 (+) Transcript_11455:264-2009(+)
MQENPLTDSDDMAESRNRSCERRMCTPKHRRSKESRQSEVRTEQLKLEKIRSELAAAKAEADAHKSLLQSLQFDEDDEEDEALEDVDAEEQAGSEMRSSAEYPEESQEEEDDEEEGEGDLAPLLAEMDADEGQSLVDELHAKVAAQDAEIKELQLELMRAERKGQQSLQEVRELQEDLEEQEHMTHTEKQLYHALKLEHEELCAEYNVLLQQAQTADAEDSKTMEELKTELQGVYESLADKDTQIETKDEEIAILRLENATTTALDEDLPTPKHVRERISDLENELAIVRARNAQLDGALEAQEEELTAQQAQIELLLNPGATQLETANNDSNIQFPEEDTLMHTMDEACDSSGLVNASTVSLEQNNRALNRDSVVLMSMALTRENMHPLCPSTTCDLGSVTRGVVKDFSFHKSNEDVQHESIESVCTGSETASKSGPEDVSDQVKEASLSDKNNAVQAVNKCPPIPTDVAVKEGDAAGLEIGNESLGVPRAGSAAVYSSAISNMSLCGGAVRESVESLVSLGGERSSIDKETPGHNPDRLALMSYSAGVGAATVLAAAGAVWLGAANGRRLRKRLGGAWV